MAFIRLEDYYEFISEENLNQILEVARGIAGDTEIRQKAEEKAISRAKDYLRPRFRIDRIFAEYKEFSISDTYVWGDRIDFTATEFDIVTSYSSSDLLSYNDKIYQKNATSLSYTPGILPTNTTFFDLRGDEATYYIAFPDYFNDEVVYSASDFIFYKFEVYQRNSYPGAYAAGVLPTNANYFTKIKTIDYAASHSVTGVWPSNAAWTEGDNRNADIVASIVHMAISKLHSIINPRNIPQLRRDNFSEAIKYLKEDCLRGDTQVDLPQMEAQSGYSIRFGSNTATTHGY